MFTAAIILITAALWLGVIVILTQKPRQESDPEREECPECDGTGSVAVECCPVCDTSGWVWRDQDDNLSPAMNPDTKRWKHPLAPRPFRAHTCKPAKEPQ
jgi:hypothetical protein